MAHKSTNAHLAGTPSRKLPVAITRPFVGCDGEGLTDAKGNHRYALFRIGLEAIEERKGNGLSTQQCLDFILRQPAELTMVGYCIGYDVTMWLRDLPTERCERLFDQDGGASWGLKSTWWEGYAITYLPGVYFSVAELERDAGVADAPPRVIEGSTRTVYEVSGYWRTSFVEAARATLSNHWWGKTIDAIAAMKAKRETFSELNDDLRRYCDLECGALKEMMEELRSVSKKLDLVPRKWCGPGQHAKVLFRRHEIPHGEDVQMTTPPEVWQAAKDAFYGGRFELFRIGQISEPVHEYDIRSAYAWAMRDLPCLAHGRWIERDARWLVNHSTDVGMARVEFRFPRNRIAYGLPIRDPHGHLYWPQEGNGTYWCEEIESAHLGGGTIHYVDGWSYERRCSCKPFAFLSDIFAQRATATPDQERLLKATLVACAGLLQQRAGKAPYYNAIWASLLQARVRTRLNLMLADIAGFGHPVMIAADALYTTEPKRNPLLWEAIGEVLGELRHREHKDGLFVVQPGFYWGPGNVSARGIARSIMDDAALRETFAVKFREWTEDQRDGRERELPSIPLPVRMFRGLRLAVKENRREEAGQWFDTTRSIHFGYAGKRGRHELAADGASILTWPRAGSPELESVSTDKTDTSEIDRQRAEEMEQPDAILITPSR